MGSKGFISKTHTGIETLFFTHFVKAGLMDARFGKMLSEARMARLTADYSGMADVPAGKAAEHLANAETFLAAVEVFLTRPAAP